jgi:hypothetical protein
MYLRAAFVLCRCEGPKPTAKAGAIVAGGQGHDDP